MNAPQENSMFEAYREVKFGSFPISPGTRTLEDALKAARKYVWGTTGGCATVRPVRQGDYFFHYGEPVAVVEMVGGRFSQRPA
jgi:hypothetical protein